MCIVLHFLQQDFTDQHWVHFDPSGLQVFADSGDLIVGQIRSVVLVHLK